MKRRRKGIEFGHGVWQAPWLGPNGETILVAVNRENRQIGEQLIVPTGGSHLAASDELWGRVESDDPMPNLKLV